MIDIGEKIFYTSLNENKVKSGVVIGYLLNGQGHKCVQIKPDDDNDVMIQQYCSLTADNAAELEKKLPNLIALSKEMIAIRSEADRKINELLDLYRGKPQFLHLETTVKAAKE